MLIFRFAYFAFAANMGGLIAKQWPALFGNSVLFNEYPYCLPCIICAVYVFVSMVLCVIWLKEECDNPMPVRSILTKKMISMLAVFGWTVTVVFSQQALFPLYLFTPVPIGGQSKTPPQIAEFGAANGLFQGFWLLFVMPRLDRRLGTRRTFNLVAFLFPFFTLLPIVANAFARSNHYVASQVVLALYVSVASVQLLLNSCAPPAAIATVNGIAVALCGIVKSIFPAVINSIFAISVSKQLLKGYLAWMILVIMAAGVFLCSLYAPRDDRAGDDLDKSKKRVLEAEGQEVMESGQL
ncbi:hypothetical protein IAU60_003035 [Kwoniella sp. DSM 27419]